DAAVVPVQRRMPVVGGAAVESIEMLEPQAQRPAVERAGRGGLPRRREVPLAHREGGVAVQLEHLGERRRRLGQVGAGVGIAAERRVRGRQDVLGGYRAGWGILVHVVSYSGWMWRALKRAIQRACPSSRLLRKSAADLGVAIMPRLASCCTTCGDFSTALISV